MSSRPACLKKKKKNETKTLLRSRILSYQGFKAASQLTPTAESLDTKEFTA
jgi:hypothetical protein